MLYFPIMRTRRSTSGLLRWIPVGALLFALVLLTLQLIGFSRSRATYPSGLHIAGVPVGRLDRQRAAERLLEIYSQPVEMRYGDNLIHLNPGVVGFELDLESMLAAADLVRTGGPFWDEFWAYLWSNQPNHAPVPLDASYSESQLRNYLTNEIAARYDRRATAAQPIAGTVNFIPGTPGTTIDLDITVFQIENALRSPTRRGLDIALTSTDPSRPSFQNLEILLKQTIDITGYDGIAGLYLLDMQSATELHFVYLNGQELSLHPDVPFTASSIIKIPIMVSTYAHIQPPYPEEALNLLSGMIEESGNDPADWVMEGFINSTRGPLIVTEDMQALGLENTFLAGFFRLGAPLLEVVDTPANARLDVNTNLDPYNQTTLSDIGMLLTDLYQCSENGGGALVAVFPDEITQNECQAMIELLTRNFTPWLIASGAPEGTRIAHKHGWVTDPSGAIRTIGDAAIVFTPSGNYVLVIYFYHPVQLVWDPVSTLIADLAQAIYNYYNVPTP